MHLLIVEKVAVTHRLIVSNKARDFLVVDFF